MGEMTPERVKEIRALCETGSPHLFREELLALCDALDAARSELDQLGRLYSLANQGRDAAFLRADAAWSEARERIATAASEWVAILGRPVTPEGIAVLIRALRPPRASQPNEAKEGA